MVKNMKSSDKKSKDRIKESTKLKKKNQVIEYYSENHLSLRGQQDLKDCWSWMCFASDTTLDKMRVFQAPSCKKRICVICSTRKSYKTAAEIEVLMRWLFEEKRQSFIFATCSVPSVTGENLKEEIDRLNAGLKRLYQSKEVKSATNGFIRKVEFTYNASKTITDEMWNGTGRYKDKSMRRYFEKQGLKIGDLNPNYKTYHLHIHFLFAVDRDYSSMHPGYLTQERWLKLWQRAMREEKPPRFHVKKYTYSPEASSRKTTQEIAKYSAKINDITHSQEVFDELYTALYKRQLLTYNGLFKDGQALYKEYKEFKNTGKEHVLDKYIAVDETEYVYLMTYKWLSKNYQQTEMRPLTTEEKNILEAYKKSGKDL
jgi:plasmid rolling circle replication initiator protein Rep